MLKSRHKAPLFSVRFRAPGQPVHLSNKPGLQSNPPPCLRSPWTGTTCPMGLYPASSVQVVALHSKASELGPGRPPPVCVGPVFLSELQVALCKMGGESTPPPEVAVSLDLGERLWKHLVKP